ncbi:MAG: hypothetical protein Q8R00_00555 [Candidatus Nanoarchaeia archaeon]|nr:hypothetical protein [Candidatus Nanoarchaeia archaeon]
MLKRTLTALVLASSAVIGCGMSGQSNASTNQSYSDETLQIAKKKIDEGEYNSAIRILEGYATNNSNTIAQRNFLLGEANLKSISSSSLMALWAPSQNGGKSPRLNEEYSIAVNEFRKTHDNAGDYFKTAIELDSELESRLKYIYLVKNKKLADADLFEPVLLARLKEVYSAYDKPSLLELINIDSYDLEAIRESRLRLLEGEYKRAMFEYMPKLPKPISVNLKGRALEKEKERWERDLQDEKERSDTEFAGEKERVTNEFEAKKAEVRKMGAFELLKPTKIKNDFDISWLKEDEVVILKSSKKEAEFLTIELSGRPELHIIKVKLAENGKLEPFIGVRR